MRRSRAAFDKGLKLQAQAPLAADWKVIRDGKVVSESNGKALNFSVTEAGNYRVEVWLTIAAEKTIWIFSNPIYIRPDRDGDGDRRCRVST